MSLSFSFFTFLFADYNLPELLPFDLKLPNFPHEFHFPLKAPAESAAPPGLRYKCQFIISILSLSKPHQLTIDYQNRRSVFAQHRSQCRIHWDDSPIHAQMLNEIILSNAIRLGTIHLNLQILQLSDPNIRIRSWVLKR